jgi:hypothetical protein
VKILDSQLTRRYRAPSISSSLGYFYWFLNDEIGLHREEGPAIEWDDGSQQWWYHGRIVSCESQEEFERWLRLKAFW